LCSSGAMVNAQNTMKQYTFTWPDVKPPVATQKDYVHKAHGDKRPDPYYWMNDYFKKGPDSTNVIKHLEAENSYFEKMMADTKQLEEDLYQEMKGRILEKDESVPYFKNGYY